AADERFFVAQRYSRGAVGLAGAVAEPLRVWIDDWEIAQSSGEAWRLRANDEEFGIDLELAPLRPPVLNGDAGLSQKSAEPGNASYYYSIPRMGSNGRIRIGAREHRVSGLSWLDREWSTSALALDQVGWDWFALQLSDGSDLMFYHLRKTDGTADASSGGTWVGRDGVVSQLGADDVEITVRDTWASPAGGEYPSRWQLRVPRFGLDVTVTPVIADQELVTIVRYWEGAVDVTGVSGAASISGRGYVELTGYAD
ncbi:MAG: lipocalin family protein, partial [Gammaproteobacteria bacterium]